MALDSGPKSRYPVNARVQSRVDDPGRGAAARIRPWANRTVIGGWSAWPSRAGGGGDRRWAGDRPGDRRRTGRASGSRSWSITARMPRRPRRPAARPKARGAPARRALWPPTSPTWTRGDGSWTGPRHVRPDRRLGQQRRGRSRRALDLLETTPESWDRVLGINLRGPFFLTQAVARAMIDARRSAVRFDRSPDRLHHLGLEHVRQRQSRRILRVQGRPEHGGPALRRPAGGTRASASTRSGRASSPPT